jgi:ribose transport system ATP-binding protein
VTAVVEVHQLEKRFPGVVALDRVSLDIKAQEVLGLVGQNGSGKSTLVKTLGGVSSPDGGTMTLRGEKYRPSGVSEANHRGVGVVFQEQSLLPNVSVAENIYLGKRHGSTTGGIYRRRGLYAAARRQLEKVHCDVSPSAVVGQLTFAQRQMVELAKVLALEEQADGPLLIMFDEPTSVLNADEVQTLFREIRRLREASAIIFVSHRLEEVLDVSDRIIVMSEGKKVAERLPHESDTDELYRLMVGSDRAQDYYLESERTGSGSTTRLKVDGLSASGFFENVSFEVKSGGVVGISGLVGSGREELCRALCGAHPVSSGKVELDGRRLRLRDPADAAASGIGYVPAERKIEGMLSGRSVHENFVISAGPELRRFGLIDRRRERGVVAEWIKRLRVRTPTPHTRIDQLSGGNQQKVTLGKWMMSEELRLLILDHPTRGLDLGAKADVYNAIREMTARGLSIVLISDTLEETLGLSDEVLVMRDGLVTGHLSHDGETKNDPEEIVRLMS